MVQRVAVEFGVNVAAVEQRTNRRREPQPSRCFGHIQRFDAEPVARECDHAGFSVDDRECEHALEVAYAIGSPPVEGLDHHFAVRARKEMVANVFQFLAQIPVVVDAAVEDQGEPEVAVYHRLSAADRQVDDRQPPVAEGDGPVGDDALEVGASRHHGTCHPSHRRYVGRPSVEADFSADATHVAFRSLRRRLVVLTTSEDPGVLASAARG